MYTPTALAPSIGENCMPPGLDEVFSCDTIFKLFCAVLYNKNAYGPKHAINTKSRSFGWKDA
jgi:hypothetical protein